MIMAQPEDMGLRAGPSGFNRVFVISLILVTAIGTWGLIDPEGMTRTALGFTNYLLQSVSWYWLLLGTGFVVLSGYMAFGPYGSIRLGRDDEEPEFSTGSWLAMLFIGGMGAGLLFWGAAEPLYHFKDPPVGAGGTPDAARHALVITNLHWGLHAWSIYGVCGLVIAYFTFRRGGSSMISTPIRVLFSERAGKPIGDLADILGVLAVVFGLAGSLAMGTLQVRSGLGEVFGTAQTHTVSMLIVAALFVCYMISATTGVDKGIKILSNVNVALAFMIMVVVIVAGPTQFIFETFTDSLGQYFAALPAMAFHMLPFEGLQGWTSAWTLTYLIWWLAWGPFVGIFIARISRGRTIREYCIGVILVPTVFSVFWFATFGGAGIYIELFGGAGWPSWCSRT
ncbi:glycine betaine transporter [Paracoccus aminovorans]|uniref:Glycine betaine transporter n=1 Tax=Paracoccus aminovorans TaxID=34004 RepID=A0A1I3ESE1_9RHOB|nr:BCCT family transporter [Paracoccus aminovorans]SFI01895.1 glycine betaine transporter [Paracoccus aminovorans]